MRDLIGRSYKHVLLVRVAILTPCSLQTAKIRGMMNNAITNLQQRYLSVLLQHLSPAKFEEVRTRLGMADSTLITDLTKDEAYRLITKVVDESRPEVVEQALTTALEK